MAAQGQPAGPSVEHGREPCPDRILDDMGSAFGMGAVGGGIFHFLKAVKNSPRNQRTRGGIEVIDPVPRIPPLRTYLTARAILIERLHCSTSCRQ